MKKSGIILSATALLLAIVALSATLFSKNRPVKYVYEPSPIGLQQVQLAESTWPDFTFAAEHAIKAVVHVTVMKRGQEQPYSFFDFFFGPGTPQDSRPQVGSGSGVIISKDGYIVTNNHVIEGADEVNVMLENNRSFTAEVVGTDPAADIALLKIEAEGLPFLVFGDSDALRLGQWVLAIGNPYNLTSTITAGIVSAKGRQMNQMAQRNQNSRSSSFRLESFIQTDAAVNPGNSGGALVTVDGELVGINTAIASRTGTFAGYSFAVPSSIAKKVVDDIRKYGEVRRPLLGISMLDITEDLARENNIKELKGVFIAEVSPDGSADLAGVKDNDVLFSINGVAVNSGSAVQEQINRYSPNDKVDLKILRDGKELNFSAVLKSRDDYEAAVRSEADKLPDTLPELLGATLQPIGREIREKLRIRSGLEVVSLIEGGRLQQAGVEVGFVITHINQTAVSSLEDIGNLLNRSQRRGLLIEGKYPDGSTSFFALPL